jgi:hypothetical protein
MAQFLVQQQPRGALANATGDSSEKNPSEVWKGKIDVLLRLTQRVAEDDLPQLWHAWANCRKEERRAVLQEQFRRMSRDLSLPEPVATVELTSMLYTLSFGASFEDKLEHGVQPFAVTYLSQKSVAEQRELIDMHELLREGSPSVKAASKISMPKKESQMLRTMRAFGVVLAVALGASSELYKAYKRDVIDSYDVIQPKLEALAELHPLEPVYAQVLRWLQLRLQEYWTEVEVAVGRVDPPNFKMLFEAIRYKQWLRPEIPIAYLTKVKRCGSDAASTLTGGTNGGGPSPANPGPPNPGAAAKKHTYARNESPRSNLVEKAPSMGKINVFLKAAENGTAVGCPKTDSGVEMCLAFHTKGGCYKDCGRATGDTTLSDGEAERLEKFINKNLALIASRT